MDICECVYTYIYKGLKAHLEKKKQICHTSRDVWRHQSLKPRWPNVHLQNFGTFKPHRNMCVCVCVQARKETSERASNYISC